MADAKVVYENKPAPAGNALFDMLTFQNKSRLEQTIDQENMGVKNKFDQVMENLKSQHQLQREQEAFQREESSKLLTGQAIADYTGQKAVQEAGAGNVIPGFVTQHQDEDVERTTGHPLFTANPIEPRAATTAHGDLMSAIKARQAGDEAIRLQQEKERPIGPAEVQTARMLAGELKAVNHPMHAVFGNITEGSVTKREFIDAATKATTELQKSKTRLEVAKVFGGARVEAAKIAGEARVRAAELAARNRIAGAEQKQLTGYASQLMSHATKLQNQIRILNQQAENSYGEEAFNYLREAQIHQATLDDIMNSHAQVTNQLGRAANQPVIDESQYRVQQLERNKIIDDLSKAGKIRKNKTWPQLTAAEQDIVFEEHKRRFAERQAAPKP